MRIKPFIAAIGGFALLAAGHGRAGERRGSPPRTSRPAVEQREENIMHRLGDGDGSVESPVHYRAESVTDSGTTYDPARAERVVELVDSLINFSNAKVWPNCGEREDGGQGLCIVTYQRTMVPDPKESGHGSLSQVELIVGVPDDKFLGPYVRLVFDNTAPTSTTDESGNRLMNPHAGSEQPLYGTLHVFLGWPLRGGGPGMHIQDIGLDASPNFATVDARRYRMECPAYALETPIRFDPRKQSGVEHGEAVGKLYDNAVSRLLQLFGDKK